MLNMTARLDAMVAARKALPMVPVYEFELADGTVTGLGTKLEFDYWTSEGVGIGDRLGKIVTHEPASEDDKRKRLWGIA